jgi:hypothetical protein
MADHPLPRHALARETFTAIARGRGGPEAVEVLRAGQLSKRALLLKALHRDLADSSTCTAPATAAAAQFDRAYRTAAGWQRTDPARWEQLLLRPELDAWAATCLRGLRAGESVPLTGLAEFAGLAPDQADPAGPGAPAPAPVLEHGGRSWSPTIHDRGRYRDLYGYRPAGPLTTDETAAWTAELEAAWAILVRRHPWYGEAIGATIRTLVPLHPAADGRTVSSAARRAYGSIAASLPAEPVLLALTLVHEFLHVQLGALMDLVPLHRPDSGARFHAPWRPDPRPAGALLQGTYAHLGVADFWRTERAAGVDADGRAEREFTLWRSHAAGAARSLTTSDELTPVGREFTTEMLAVLESWTAA